MIRDRLLSQAESDLEQTKHRLLSLLTSDGGRNAYREIRTCILAIYELGIIIQHLLFLINRLLIYIIRSFHRDRHSSRYVSTSDGDSFASYSLQLSNYGAVKGMP